MQLQIDAELFLELWKYFYFKEQKTAEETAIFEALDEKVNKILARTLYSKYKRAATQEERDAARLEYLKHKEIFRL